MAFRLDQSPIYVKGTADMWVIDIATGNVLAYTNLVDTSNFSSSVNAGEIRSGLGAPVVINIPDSATFTGEVTSQDFSLVARQLATGGVLKYNGKVMVSEEITATGTTLTLSQTPVEAYGANREDALVDCYVGKDGVNYGVNPTTKVVQGFTATAGTKYCVKYYIEAASAQELIIPANFAPVVARVIVRMAAYSAQGNSAMSSSIAGYVYVHIPRAQFINGDVSIDGSQTANAMTSWSFTALANDNENATCDTCAVDSKTLGYMVYAPCGNVLADVESIAIPGTLSVAVGETKQIPVLYVMKDGSTVMPRYEDLTYTVGSNKATVANGRITGATAGSDTLTVKITDKQTITTTVPVTVTAAS